MSTYDTPNSHNVRDLMKTASVSGVFYREDPLSTGCVENQVLSEYAQEAEEIVKMLKCGFPLQFSVKTVFDTAFWDDCLNEETLTNICEKMSACFPTS